MWDRYEVSSISDHECSYEKFLISNHESFVKNLNKISDDLLKAKWYFIAAISAIGFAYKFVIEDSKLLSISTMGPLMFRRYLILHR